MNICNTIVLVCEDLPGLVLDHELHVLDTLAPGANLLSHGHQLLSVQNPGLDPGQHDALLNLGTDKQHYTVLF